MMATAEVEPQQPVSRSKQQRLVLLEDRNTMPHTWSLVLAVTFHPRQMELFLPYELPTT